MNLDFITKNPIIKSLALGKLKDACRDNGITAIMVTPDPITGELDFKTYTEPVVTVSKTDYETLLKLATQ